MKIHIERGQLLSVLKIVGAAVASTEKSDKPYQSSVLVSASAAGIAMCTNSSTLHIQSDVTGEIKEGGKALLSHKRLVNNVSQLPTGLVEITVNDKLQVKIKSLSSKRNFSMQALDPDLFPPVLAPDNDEPLFGIEAKIFQQVGGETGFVVDDSFIDGMLLSPIDDKRFGFVGMSGRGMSIATAWFTKSRTRNELVIPRALMEAIGALPGDQTELLLSATDRRVTVRAPGITLACDQLQQNFPSVWEGVKAAAPKDRRFRVSSTALLESVRAVSVAADAEGTERFVQIDLTYKDSQCIVSTRKGSSNFGEDEVPVRDPADGECIIHMDGARLSSALRAFEPADLDVFYDVMLGQAALLLQNENLSVFLTPMADVKAKGG